MARIPTTGPNYNTRSVTAPTTHRCALGGNRPQGLEIGSSLEWLRARGVSERMEWLEGCNSPRIFVPYPQHLWLMLVEEMSG